MTARLLIGDVRETVATLPGASVDLVLTSPPFLALRSYLPADHPDKAQEIGSEATPGAFIDTLLDVVEACARVLAPHGSMCIELGDTYSGSGGAGGDYGPVGLREGQPTFDGTAARTRSNRPGQYGTNTGPTRRVITDDWPLDKSLCLIPELFRVALVYGFNPLTGRTTPRWRARNVIRWCRPNPPVGALADKFRPATSEMVVVCKSRNRYFDLDAVRNVNDRTDEVCNSSDRRRADERFGARETNDQLKQNPAGAPPLDWWNIPTHGYPGAHYATFPEQLCVRPIEAMCPRRVCTVCGEPSRRIVEADRHQPSGREPSMVARQMGDKHGTTPLSAFGSSGRTTYTSLGWSDCACPGLDKWRPGLVLDPFAGSGTTMQVSVGHGRDAIGIDLDGRNRALVEQRLGMFLQPETVR